MPTNHRPHKRRLDQLACVHPNAAGLDIGSAEIVVAVPPDRDPQPVRVFQTFTLDLHALIAWLLACGIDTMAKGDQAAGRREDSSARSASFNVLRFSCAAPLDRD